MSGSEYFSQEASRRREEEAKRRKEEWDKYCRDMREWEQQDKAEKDQWSAEQHRQRFAEYEKLKRIGEELRKNTVGEGSTEDLHGDTRFYPSPYHDLRHLAYPDRGFIGTPLAQGLVWNIRQDQGHSCVFGSSRSGKGVSSLIPALLSYGGSMVVIDPKGENAWATAERRRRMGHRVVILDPWGEVNKRYGSKVGVKEQTSRFNPLSAIDPQSEDFSDDLAAVADALIISATGDGVHFTDSAKQLIAGLTAAQIEANPGKAHLGQVRDALTQDDEWLADLVKGIRETNPNSLAARKLRRFAKAADSKEIGSIRSTAETQTSLLDSNRLVEAMRTDDPPFNLEDLARTRCTLYLVLPLDRLESHGRWLRLILTMAIRAIARQETPPKAPVMFLLDEMGTIGALRMVEQAFGLMAGIGIRIVAYLQDLPQLQRDYPNSWETFISNSSVIQAFKVKDLTTSNYLSELLGNRTVHQLSAETVKIRASKQGHRAMSDQVFSRPLMLPQEIRGKAAGDVLTILEGKPFLLPRLIYHAASSPWRGLYRPSPLHPASKAA